MRKLHIVAWTGILLSVFMLIFNMVNKTGSIVMTIGLFVLIIIFFCLWLFDLLDRKKRPSPEHEDETNKAFDVQTTEKEMSSEEGDTDLALFRRRISHSVRMPMSVIAGYGDLLQKGKCKPEDEKDYIRKICQNIKYLKLTYQMLLEEDEGEEVEFDVGDVVATYVDQVEEYVKKKNIRIEMNRRHENIKVRGNPMDLMRILYNVTENSLKYMEQGTEIYITVDHVDNQAVIIYRDDGKGISQSEIEYLTEENYRGSNVVDSNATKGYGYGLYMVKGIVDRWNGTMQIKSAIGKGFSIYFFFPVSGEGGFGKAG